MKRISIILFLMMLSLGYSFAQSNAAKGRGERKTPEERAEMRTNKMVEELSLNTDQASKIKEINLNQAKKMKAVRENQKEQRQDFRQEVRAIAGETEKAYQAILTPEQFEKYQQNKAQKRENYRSGKKGHKNPRERS